MEGHIFLIGFMGAGKSTVARTLSEQLQRKVVEMDEQIEREQGMSIPEIFSHHGEEYFRNLESRLIADLEGARPAVISCGGGVVLRPENVEQMKKSGSVVYLTAAPETIYERVKDSTQRPILNGHMNVAYIADLMEKRRARYEAAADVCVATDGRSVEEICDEIRRE